MTKSEKAKRDEHIKELFEKMKLEMRAGEAIEEISNKYYPHLQYDTVRQILYSKSKDSLN